MISCIDKINPLGRDFNNKKSHLFFVAVKRVKPPGRETHASQGEI